MKPALHSVSYAGVWSGQTRLSLPDFLTKASTLGYGAVMLMCKRPHLSILDYGSAARRELRQQLGDLGLELACLAGYNDFCLGNERPDIPLREMQILYIRELSRLASELDCKLVRVFTGYSYANVGLDQGWGWCADSLRECAKHAAEFGVTIGVQNHHDTGAHYETLFDLLQEVNEPNCKAMFDAWAPALHGSDLVQAVKTMAPYIVHTTVADYVRRPRYSYVPNLVNYVRDADAVRAVPMGEGFIDYKGFFRALHATGYQGYVAYEMCSYLRGGGSEANLDRCARKFLAYMAEIS